LKEDTTQLRIDVKRAITETESTKQGITLMRPKIDSVESNMRGLLRESKDVHDHVEVIERDLGRLVSASAMQRAEFAAVSEQLNRIERTIIAVATTKGSIFLRPQPPAPDNIDSSANMHQDCEPNLPGRPTSISLSTQKSQIGYQICFCRKRKVVRYQGSYTIGWLRFLSRSEKVVIHSESCPYWNPRFEEQSIELAVEHVGFALRTAIRLAIKATRGAGGLSLSPLLTLRGYVREESPISELFGRPPYWYKFPKNLGDYLDHASSRMLQLFQEGGASPYDVDKSGSTILHVSENVYCVAEPYITLVNL
jgi:hypothetical protein